jgi:hypothetical protein
MTFSPHPRRIVLAVAALGACLLGPAAATADDQGAPRACSTLDVPARPAERIWCTTPNATLSIAHQSDPVLLDGTEVRVLSALLDGAVVDVRLRVRNATQAEQGLSAGGQELYLYLDGERIDANLLRIVRFEIGAAKTVTMSYILSPEQVAALAARDGRIDFGVRPWTQSVLPAPLIGVVRVRVASR